MSEMSWQLRHPDYGLMRIDLEETTTREGWTGKYLDSKRSLFTSMVDGTSRKLSYTDTDASAYSVEFLRGNSDDNAPEDADRIELVERRGYIVPQFRGQGARVMFAAVGEPGVDKRLHRVNLWALLLQTALTFIAATLVIEFFPKFFEKINEILVPSFLNGVVAGHATIVPVALASLVVLTVAYTPVASKFWRARWNQPVGKEA
ncbi:MAG: hypothetical protein E7K06_06335 [Corynebacterium sp.]|uniref:hypothetical protein n=1 Tax=Corynebacterium TaxID=1716 RepID=UPI0019070116|nr:MULTISPECIES: hypothetical protein [Corynebacterium]MDK8586509.1 hypothetical protein [Corynebacterium kefirresidentii]MDK8837480.1 hypothetical protein [Corynebacterium kefirresidentii]MDU3164857.1 hypothetical protein [Corynebacterium sp.]MDU4407784.1 hypothetical protein [Corynebacterium sp.]MDU4633661.1 hypothetical protein [Corynebacterium sp.]